MKRLTIAVVVGVGLALGAIAAQAKLPPAPPKSDADKAADAAKAAASKEKAADKLNKAMDKAVANYNKNKGGTATPAAASMATKK